MFTQTPGVSLGFTGQENEPMHKSPMPIEHCREGTLGMSHRWTHHGAVVQERTPSPQGDKEMEHMCHY